MISYLDVLTTAGFFSFFFFLAVDSFDMYRFRYSALDVIAFFCYFTKYWKIAAKPQTTRFS